MWERGLPPEQGRSPGDGGGRGPGLARIGGVRRPVPLARITSIRSQASLTNAMNRPSGALPLSYAKWRPGSDAVISLDDAPKGYEDFDKGAAKKFVLNPHGDVKV